MNIGYDMIIGRDLMVKLGLITNYKRNVLVWLGRSLSTYEKCISHQLETNVYITPTQRNLLSSRDQTDHDADSGTNCYSRSY